MNCVLGEAVSKPRSIHLSCFGDPEPWWRIGLSLIPLVLLILTVVSLLLAARSIRNTRAIARQKATLDLIEKVESSDHYRKIVKAFAQVTAEQLARLNAPGTDADRDMRQHVLDYLNHYELVAVGIERDILDDAFYRRWIRGYVIVDWNRAADFVQAERWRKTPDGADYEYREELFASLQTMVTRWSRSATALTAASSAKPPIGQGPPSPGDLPLPPPDPADS